MSLQPTNLPIDRETTSPFLLRLFWRQNRDHHPSDYSIAPPTDQTNISDYSSLLPAQIRQQSVQIYTWPNCTLGELTGLLTSVLPEGILPTPAVGTRLVYKLVFPDTRAEVGREGRGKWIDKPLGNVVIGGNDAHMRNGDDDAATVEDLQSLEGDAEKTLGDARFVIGDYVVCSIYSPGQDGRVAALPPISGRGGFGGRGGPGHSRENGFVGGGWYGGGRGGGGGFRGGYGGGRGGGVWGCATRGRLEEG
ncbi:hypothetical protein LTR62_008053 [Meristemomyces frigidus]|uniref:Sin3-associated polypeptide Sap18 n=1 Tax=Meristemomyces frigidus TaxID=1508187 RepID=A0AAN7YRD7_9PEZI|nr:hypothetical protein LTR62_008053 [Meristemomyces frigidus]